MVLNFTSLLGTLILTPAHSWNRPPACVEPGQSFHYKIKKKRLKTQLYQIGSINNKTSRNGSTLECNEKQFKVCH